MNDHLRSVLLGTAHVERGQVLAQAGIRTGLVFALLATGSVAAGQPSLALPLAIGCVFVAFAEAGEGVGRRWRTMAWVTLWIMVAALGGSLLAGHSVAAVAVSGVVAVTCGVAGVAGPRAALGGLLALVTFTIFLGAPGLPTAALHSALVVGLGGMIITLVTVGPHVVRDPESLRASMAPLPGLWKRIRPQLGLENAFVRHGIRLAVLIIVATVLSLASGVEHSYWLPMTIAWVTKPDPDGTVSRVAGRIVGTIVGLGLCALLLEIGHVSGYAAVALCAVAAGVVIAFTAANYAVAVAAITVLVVALFAIQGDSVTTEIDVRLAATLLAAAMTVAASYIWRPSRC